jgi:hypothetical protein
MCLPASAADRRETNVRVLIVGERIYPRTDLVPSLLNHLLAACGQLTVVHHGPYGDVERAAVEWTYGRPYTNTERAPDRLALDPRPDPAGVDLAVLFGDEVRAAAARIIAAEERAHTELWRITRPADLARYTTSTGRHAAA